MDISWEELPDVGLEYRCTVEHYIYPDTMHCRMVASKGVPETEINNLKKNLPGGVGITGKAVCGIHQTMIERDFK